jgi:glutamate carboxypeptidase
MKRTKLIIIYWGLLGCFNLVANGKDDICRKELGNSEYVFLEQLVKINTCSENTEGLNTARALVADKFKDIGFSVKALDLENKHKLLFFSMSDQPKIFLIGHLDTVFKRALPDGNFSCIPEESKVSGQGVIDMKGGLVLISSILGDLKNRKKDIKDVGILINDDEETGSFYSKTAMQEITKTAKGLLVFEPGLSNGALVKSSSGVKWIEIRVKGKAAHAGLEHRLGVNACVNLSQIINRISMITDYSKDITVNVGSIIGGVKPNVVCDSASAQIDIRYKNHNDLNNVMASINDIIKGARTTNPFNNISTTAQILDIMEMPPLESVYTDNIRKYVQQAFKDKKLLWEHVGYGSDGNNLSVNRLDMLVGAGPYGGGMHTDQEFMLLSGFRERKELMTDLIIYLLSKE